MISAAMPYRCGTAALIADAEGGTMARGKTGNSRTVASSNGALFTMKTAWADNMLRER
jgi:hypothetical protein